MQCTQYLASLYASLRTSIKFDKVGPKLDGHNEYIFGERNGNGIQKAYHQ